MSDTDRTGAIVFRGVLHLLSLSAFGSLLLAIFAIHTGLLGLWTGVPVLTTLGTIVSLRYVAVYHQFSRSIGRLVLLVPLAVAAVVSSAVTYRSLVSAELWPELRRVASNPLREPTYQSFLPEWWIGPVLLGAGILALLGVLWNRDTNPYPRPTEIRDIAQSPVYFGLACTVFGLWAVLFVGIGIQRVIVIAPIFEEALKFGVALVIGATLFGRSTGGRVAAAAVAGLSFGVIEHATTYPTEPDTIYLFRSLFHMTTAILSVSVYSYFESTDRADLSWISPILPMMFHFFYNTFAVLSSIIMLFAFGSQSTVPTMIYGGLTVLCITLLIVLSWARHWIVTRLYEPFAYVLSDLA